MKPFLTFIIGLVLSQISFAGEYRLRPYVDSRFECTYVKGLDEKELELPMKATNLEAAKDEATRYLGQMQKVRCYLIEYRCIFQGGDARPKETFRDEFETDKQIVGASILDEQGNEVRINEVYYHKNLRFSPKCQ